MRTGNNKVSVIIPTFNRVTYLSEAIESVLSQSYDNLELIVVDDGSFDNTRDLVHSFSDERIGYFYQKNNGIASALNLGLKKSSGDYIARLDSDDIFLPEKLKLQVKLLDHNPDLGLVYTQAYNMDDKGNALKLFLKNHTCPQEPLKVLRHFLFPPSQSIMFRRSCIDKIGYFDETMPVGEDWDFCIRMAQKYRFAYCDEPLVKIRKHPDMITSDKIKTAQSILQVMEKHVETLSLGEGKEWLAPHYHNLGRLYLHKRNYKNAREYFYGAFRLNPIQLKNLLFGGAASLPPSIFEGLRRIKGLF
ncbi:MAG: glycosyltransferase [bacterium]